ncbi:MAG TPA: carboxy terminal-processing peptidase [Polyangiaceae bacterium]|nr:carboxy terminal-processing peptidase [Polyangiaceae bacterium]
MSRLIVIALAVGACSPGVRGRAPGPSPAVSAARAPRAPAEPSTEANLIRLTTNMLERSQFAHHPLDADLAAKFLDGYVDSIDGSRSVFLQSDIAEFARYRPTLANLTRNSGDTSAARVIWARYLERLEQQTQYATELLHTDSFDFTGHDVYSLDREHAERPRDLAAARALWRQRLRAEYLQEKLADAPPAKIVETLEHRYSQELALMKGLSQDEVLDIYLNALAHVYDPHSDYLGHEEMENLSIQMNLALFGIGATLENSDGACVIRALVPGGPAARSGVLKPGDRIVAVAQTGKAAVEIKNMPLSRTVELIRGPKGTPVTLSILPDGAPDGSLPKLVPLVRDAIKLEDEAARAEILDLPLAKHESLRLGVVNLPSFYADMGDEGTEHRSATKDVARLLKKLEAEKVQGIVLDLRHNGGGSLNEAISLTGLFIHSGPVVQTRDPNGAVHVGDDDDPTEQYTGPLVVLTSRFSASASEILTGALKDYGRAVIVGDSSTFGKGTVQSILPLARIMDEAGIAHTSDPGALKITIQKFYRPDGASTQLRGVVSDIVLPSPSDSSDVSESEMKSPLPWDAVPPVPHEQVNAVEPYLETLRAASKARVGSEKAFALLADDIVQLRAKIATKSVSLNETERRAEVARAKAELAEREAASKALRASAPTAYEITLKDAESPGLPPARKLTDETERDRNTASTSRSLQSREQDLAGIDDIILNEATRVLADYTLLLRHGSASTHASMH